MQKVLDHQILSTNPRKTLGVHKKILSPTHQKAQAVMFVTNSRNILFKSTDTFVTEACRGYT